MSVVTFIRSVNMVLVLGLSVLLVAPAVADTEGHSCTVQARTHAYTKHWVGVECHKGDIAVFYVKNFGMLDYKPRARRPLFKTDEGAPRAEEIIASYCDFNAQIVQTQDKTAISCRYIGYTRKVR